MALNLVFADKYMSETLWTYNNKVSDEVMIFVYPHPMKFARSSDYFHDLMAYKIEIYTTTKFSIRAFRKYSLKHCLSHCWNVISELVMRCDGCYFSD